MHRKSRLISSTLTTGLIIHLRYDMQAFKLVENFPGAVPYVFLITDGAVDNEKNICLTMQSRIVELGARAPRISTFGIGRWSSCKVLKNEFYLRLYCSSFS